VNVRRQAGQPDFGAIAPFLELARGGKGVATVVSAPSDQPDERVVEADDFGHVLEDVRYAQAGPFHQHFARRVVVFDHAAIEEPHLLHAHQFHEVSINRAVATA